MRSLSKRRERPVPFDSPSMEVCFDLAQNRGFVFVLVVVGQLKNVICH